MIVYTIISKNRKRNIVLFFITHQTTVSFHQDELLPTLFTFDATSLTHDYKCVCVTY